MTSSTGEFEAMESKNRTAHILYTDGQIITTSPYDADFVSALKSGLKSRRWNPEKKGWIVDIKERQKLIEIASRFYQVVEDNRPAATPVCSSRPDAEPTEAPQVLRWILF